VSSESTENSFTAELVIKPVPSRWLLSFIVLVYLLALGVLFLLSGLPVWLMIPLVFLVLGSLVYSLLLHSGRLANRWVDTLYWRETGGWELVTGTGEHLPVIFCESSFSSVFVDVLNVRTRAALGGQRFTVILLGDNSDQELRRCLRVRLGLRSMRLSDVG